MNGSVSLPNPWVCRRHHDKLDELLDWTRSRLKAKNKLKRLARRIKGYEQSVSESKSDQGVKRPGSLKK